MTTLSDLFISYKQVEPPAETPAETSSDKYIFYSNLDRAKQVTSSDNLNWKVGGSSNYENSLGWSVAPYNNNQTLEDYVTSRPEMEVISHVTGEGPWYEEAKKDKYKPRSSNLQSAQYWLNQLKRIGMNDMEAMVLAGSIFSECNNDHTQVNKSELRGISSNTKTHGWANAGEGLVQFTFWDKKKKLIEQYNKDPRRRGEPLTTDKNEYSKTNVRHIVDVPKEDAILFVEYFYKDLIGKYNNFDDLTAAFYLRKAGNHAKNRENKSMIQQAWETGIYYNDYHNRQKDRTKKIDTNNFAKALRFTYDLGTSLGMLS